MKPSASSLHDLLDQSTEYHIPMYQRDYTWQTEEISDFISDFLEAFSRNSQRFFGTILLSDNAPYKEMSSDRHVLYVIDGQQRITTSLICLVALRHLALDLAPTYTQSRDVAEGIYQRLTVEPSEVGGSRRPRLHANRSNAQFIQSLMKRELESLSDVEELLNNGIPENTKNSCRRLYEAYLLAYQMLRDEISTRTGGAETDDPSTPLNLLLVSAEQCQVAADHIQRCFQHFTRHSLVVKIEITDWLEAFELFDGLNNRGMELAKREVLKNVLFSRAARSGGETELRFVESKWDEFKDLLPERTFARFLRHYLLLTNKSVSLGGSTRTFLESTEGSEARSTVEELIKVGTKYQQIIAPSENNCRDRKTREKLDSLVVLSAERIRPIILAALLSNVSKPKLVYLLETLEALQFRRSAICQQDNKILENAVQHIAERLLVQGNDGVEHAVVAIRKLSPSDTLFRKMFEEKSHLPPAIARYLLLKIENHIRSERRQLPVGQATLEHILPQKPLQHWRKDPKVPGVRELIGRIGNLTLLRQQDNSEVGNLGFAKKKRVYGHKEESLNINHDVVTATQWTRSQIIRRQKRLAVLALAIWSLD